MHLENLPFNYEEAVAVLLFVIGFCMLLFSRNLIKKVIGLDIMDSGIFLLLADRGYIAGRTAPIIVDDPAQSRRRSRPMRMRCIKRHCGRIRSLRPATSFPGCGRKRSCKSSVKTNKN